MNTLHRPVHLHSQQDEQAQEKRPEDEYIELLFTERQKHNLTEGHAINGAA